MNNEKLLDILSDIDDSLISDALQNEKSRNKKNFGKIILFAAAVFAFTVISLAVGRELFFREYTVLPSEQESTGVSEENKTEIPYQQILPEQEITTEENITGYTQEITTPSEIPSGQGIITPSTAEPSSAEEKSTAALYSPVPEPSSEENTTELSDSPDTLIFNETSPVNLISVTTDSLPEGYSVTEKVNITVLEQLYGTRIIPSYLPEKNNNSVLGTDKEKEYTVFFNSDKSDYVCLNSLSFYLEDNSILTIKASTREIPSLQAEKNNMSHPSYINGIPVILLKSDSISPVKIYSACFQINGCYFRLQLTGIKENEAEFIKILSSLI